MLVNDPEAVEACLQFWATSLGVDEERLETEGVTVVPNATPLPIKGIVLLRRRNACVLSVIHPEPSQVIESVMEIARGSTIDDLMTEKKWEDVATSFAAPATVFAIARNRIPPLPPRGARMLSGSDHSMRVGRLMDRADPVEWERGGVDVHSDQLAGIFDGEDLVGAGLIEKGSEKLGIVRIFVAAGSRRRGLGSSLISFLSSRPSTTFRALQMTVVKGDKSGEETALKMGFFPFGETASVALKD